MIEEKARVLVVEDDPNYAELIRDALRMDGRSSFETIHVVRLGEALRVLGQDRPDAVVLDLSLPDSAGMETVTRARASAPEVPIVVMSALDDERLALRAVQKGAQDYLVKGPEAASLLPRSIRYAMERQRLLRELDESCRREHARLRELDESCQREQARLRELDQLKSDLVAFVSHELRQPLTVIMGSAYTLLAQGPEAMKEAGPEYCSRIAREAERVTRLVNAFLDLARIEAGRPIQLLIDRYSVREIVEEALEIQRASASHCAFEAEYEAVDTVLADRDKLLQVLLNLLSNADKYSVKGGTVRIHVRSHGRRIRFEVSDQGLGIPEEALAQLFTPFYRVQDGRQKKIRGTGLGLYLCKLLVEAHGGRIWAESAPGKGSTFSVEIPAGSGAGVDGSGPANGAR